MQKGDVKKWLIFYQIARQSGGRRLIFNELTQKGSPLQCHFDRSRSAANRKAFLNSRCPLRWQANVICRRAAATRKSRETLPTGANAAARSATPMEGALMCRPGANFGRLAHPLQDVHSKGCTRVSIQVTLHYCSTQGQLRLTWRLHAESPQSGEISLLNGTNCIVKGDLGALSLNRARCFCLHIDMQLRSR